MGLHQTKGFCAAKENINEIKRQATGWENIFANTSDKGVISTIYTELTKLNTKKPQTTRLKNGTGPQKTLFQRGHMHGQ